MHYDDDDCSRFHDSFYHDGRYSRDTSALAQLRSMQLTGDPQLAAALIEFAIKSEEIRLRQKPALEKKRSGQ